MNIEEDFAVTATCLFICINTVASARQRRRHRQMHAGFFFCISHNKKKNKLNILRDKTFRGVPCDSTFSKIAAKLDQVSSTLETLAISRRQLHEDRAEIAAGLHA